MKKVLLIISLLAIISGYGVANAAHYILGVSAVDDGEIRWGGTSTYLTQYNLAVQTWNNYGPINIAPDTWQTYEDLHISDVNNLKYTRFGVYDDNIGTDTLKFNIARMKKLDDNGQRNVATHELGHALGLAHSIPNNIMVAVGELDRINLGTQDESDYDYLWR